METQKTISEWAASVGIDAEPERAIERAAEEMEEALDEIRNDNISHAGVELADVAICLFVAAEKMGVDLQYEIDCKMIINRAREWRKDETGCVYHVKPACSLCGDFGAVDDDPEVPGAVVECPSCATDQ